MTIAKGNTRLPVTLNEKRKQGLKRLNTKYKKSESKLMCIALDMLLEQEKRDLRFLRSESDRTLFSISLKCYHFSLITFISETVIQYVVN